ncbi:hypothetical protein [Cohnella sp.]|uniref:hypothetical protein n=1 Tax=Cohnella sp. TaxID=1883426 RepID=UPI00356322B1
MKFIEDIKKINQSDEILELLIDEASDFTFKFWIKWDGHVEIYSKSFEEGRFCPSDYEMFTDLLAKVYDIAQIHFGDSWEPRT